MGKKTFKLRGFQQSEKEIELPNLGEILMWPFFENIEAEEFYKYASEYQRRLLDQAPLKNDKKHVVVVSNFQHLSPYDKPIYNKVGYENEWHIDFFTHDSRCHLLLSDCSALTEFNTSDIDLEMDENISWLDFNSYLNDNQENIGLKGERMKPNKFVTFDKTNAHRARSPKEHEFRFFFRIEETDVDASVFKGEKTSPDFSRVFRGKERMDTKNIVHRQHSIEIRNSIPYKFKNKRSRQ